MKIAVFSDSHGNTDNMFRAIEEWGPDCVIHLGDHVRDAELIAEKFPGLPLHSLRGNCDLGAIYAPEDLLIELEGVRIFAAHGHKHGVKLGLVSFCNSVHFSGSALGLFGHTHQPLHQHKGSFQILNPGSVGDYVYPTYARVIAENGEARCSIEKLYGFDGK